MRARNLKPGFFKNEILSSFDPLVRILFEGLWCMADRSGRLEDRSLRIKAEVLPYDLIEIESYLQKLHDNKFITRYEVNGNKYIEINNFLKHQTPHWQEQDSSIPSPNIKQRKPRVIQDKSKCNPSDSPFSDSPFSDSPFRSFQDFWQIYPKKIGKGKAKESWEKIKPDASLVKKMIEKIELFKQTEQWKKDRGQFIPNPATWLNQGRWEDEVTPQSKEVPKYLKGLKKVWEGIQDGKDPISLPDDKIGEGV